MAVEQGSHPSLDLVSTSEVITALSRKQEVKTHKTTGPRNTAKNGLHNTSDSVELDRTHPSMVPAHEISPGFRRRLKSGVRTISK